MSWEREAEKVTPGGYCQAIGDSLRGARIRATPCANGRTFMSADVYYCNLVELAEHDAVRSWPAHAVERLRKLLNELEAEVGRAS